MENDPGVEVNVRVEVPFDEVGVTQCDAFQFKGYLQEGILLAVCTKDLFTEFLAILALGS